LKFLEDIENRLSFDIAKLQEEETKPTIKKGVRVTREMILKASMVDTAAEVNAVMLRDCNIEVFDDNRTQPFRLEELCNVECLFLSHNLIKDCLGIS